MVVDIYTPDKAIDFARYQLRGVDGSFTNDTPSLLRFQHDGPDASAQTLLTRYGY